MAKVTNRDRYGNIIDVDQMLKRFKKEVQKDGTLEDLRKHEYFLPKSIARKEKSKKHQRLMSKLNKKSKRVIKEY